MKRILSTCTEAFVIVAFVIVSSRSYHQGSCQVWINGSVKEKVTILHHAMATIYFDALSFPLRGRVCFLPEVGGEFIRYNDVLRPTHQMKVMQNEFEVELFQLQKVTFNTNYQLGVLTPKVLDCILKTSAWDLYILTTRDS